MKEIQYSEAVKVYESTYEKLAKIYLTTKGELGPRQKKVTGRMTEFLHSLKKLYPNLRVIER